MRFFCAFFLSFATITSGWADALPVPRFVSLRSNAVNTHVGPGKQYPIDWQYVRQSMPVEIVAEFDTWRQIRDWQGTLGWVHKSMLSGRRTVWVLHKTRNLRKSPEDQAKVVARLEPGIVGRIIECQAQWCRMEVKAPMGTFKGWIKRRYIWGVYPNETSFK
ncbi:MAG: SH3 domain-containing protein [Alphaproteobacteria bacterium]|nr:SH3 domain-containing protein [Alphaproteobacteria bacterium]